jgi:hypothetical protein
MTTPKPKLKLYTVTITHELVVLAESREDAESAARRELKNEMPDVDVATFRQYPGHYGPESLPYGYQDPDDPDRTIGAWISSGKLDTSER